MDYFKIAHMLHLFPSKRQPMTGSDMSLPLSSIVTNCINTAFGVRHVDCAGAPATDYFSFDVKVRAVPTSMPNFG